jgi:MYXO-CTERM domain-containing protein
MNTRTTTTPLALAAFFAASMTFVSSTPEARAECQEPQQLWAFETAPHHMEADGSIVLVGGFYGYFDRSENDPERFQFWRASDRTPVEGTMDFIEIGGQTRAAWTPNEPLEVGERIEGTSQGNTEFAMFSIDVVDAVQPATVRLSDLHRREFEFPEKQFCCPVDIENCQDPCASNCSRCAVDSYTYPDRVGFRATIEDAPPNDVWAVYYEVLQADGETPFDTSAEAAQVTSIGSFSPYATEVPEGTADFCVRHEVRHVLTGEVASSDVTCATDSLFSEANRTGTDRLEVDLCSQDYVNVLHADEPNERWSLEEMREYYALADGGNGEFGDTTPDGVGTTKEESGGCSTAGGSPGMALLLLGLFAMRRRSRALAAKPCRGELVGPHSG